jgi:HTH-type transcriptional regulator / antitoxin HigA
MDKRTAKKVRTRNIAAGCQAWAALEDAIGTLSAANTEQNAAHMMGLLDEVLELQASRSDVPGTDRFVEYLTDWVEAYEATQQPIPDVSPIDLLRHLMEANGLKQSDLAEEFGGQPVVSAVLRGKRQINVRQAFALGKRFGLAAAAFIENAAAKGAGVEDDSLVTEGEIRVSGLTNSPASTGTRAYERQLTSGGPDLTATGTHWLDRDSSQQITLTRKGRFQ